MRVVALEVGQAIAVDALPVEMKHPGIYEVKMIAECWIIKRLPDRD